MGRPQSFDDEVVLKKAMIIFWKHGFSKTSMRDLERATGLTASSIYNRFESKDKLFNCALVFYIENVVKYRINRYLKENDNDGASGLRSFFDSTFESIEPHRGPFSCLLVRTSLDSSASNLIVIQHLDYGFSLIEKAFADSLSRAKNHGIISLNCNVEFWARHLLVCFNGLLVEMNFRPDKSGLSNLVGNIFNTLPIIRSN